MTERRGGSGLRWTILAWVAGPLLAAAAPVLAAGAAVFDCHPSLDIERKEMAALAKGLKEALSRDDRRRLRNMLSNPLRVRLDGKQQTVDWATIEAHYKELFGPRVRAAVDAGKLVRVGKGWVMGDGVVFLGLHPHGKACSLEVERVFEEPPPDASPGE
jgi:hypothetical protein